jgi:hypothetical protein
VRRKLLWQILEEIVSLERQQALEYLRAPAGGLWRWTENGAVLVWRDGTTIAFREEIAHVIEWLAPQGLPSFGAIVFLLAACRGKLPAVPDIVTISGTPLPPYAGKDAATLTSARAQLKAQLEAALGQLAKVSHLPHEVITGLNAKSALAEAVFEPAKVERYVEARTILRGMREPMNDADLVDNERTGVSGSYIRQIHILGEGLKHHTAESLALRMRTSLDALPKPADVNLPAAERARKLIEELSRDREFGSVARAARELMAAVRLPRRLGEREQLAIGGVADITNRGPLDRLLLSELAHDDLTLAARVALNEALYLRREPPMREPPGALGLLLDSGVRLWGIPRVLATAVALALIARDKQHSEVMAWRAHGKKLETVDLLSRNGLTQHLAALEPSAHAGESVPAFADALSPSAQNQSVLITHRDALDDPGFRRALAENPAAPGFVATVDREGRFELHALPLAHRPALCEADLDLGAVFEGPAAVPPLKAEIDPELPAIFGVSPFPFLLPLAGRVDFWIKSADGFVYAMLNDRRLARFRDQRLGARVLASDLPGGRTIWMDADGEEVHVVKLGSNQRPARLLSVSLPDGQLRVADLASGPEIQGVHRYGDAIVAIRSHDVLAYSLADGRLLEKRTNPYRVWHGRYLRSEKGVHFVVWDGASLRFEPVTLPRKYLVHSVAAIFDRQGLAGPWLLFRSGEVVSAEDETRIKLPEPSNVGLGFAASVISRDGHRIFVPNFTTAPGAEPAGCLFSLLDKEKVLDVGRMSSLVLEPTPPLPNWNVFRVVESFARFEDGIALCGRKNKWRKLALDGDGKLRISGIPLTREIAAGQKLSEQPRKTRHGCSLQMVQFPGGSKVFLDSRGLLHFKSSDPSVPEVSVVLADGEAAGWTSDGFTCGPSFFFDFPHASDPKSVAERIGLFFDRL